jgi:hypothetical protein
VALLFVLSCINGRRSLHLRSRSRLQPQRRRLILDGLVSISLRLHPPRDGRRRNETCSLYLVFKEPRRREPFASRPTLRNSPITFAIASMTPFRGTFRAYDADVAVVNPCFVTPSVLRTALSVEPGKAEVAADAFQRQLRCL